MGVLKIENLRKTYKKRVVLKSITMEARQGQVVALLGPNGAGKTTCFYAIAGLVKADAGQIHLNDQDISHLPMYRRARMGIGYLPQEPSIFRGMSVEDNILAILEMTVKGEAAREERLEELISDFSIGHIRRAHATALSGGERRRVEIARALASNPKYILLDEPFAGVDPIAIDDIRQLVRHLVDRDIGVIITDHNVRDTLEIVDRAYIIYEGEVLMSGTAEEVIANDEVKRVYLGHSFQ